MSAEEGLPPRRRLAATLCIAVGIAVTVLDAAMVNVALPGIARDLGISPATATWVVNAYQLAVVGLLLPFANLGEVLGFRRVYQAGLSVYVLGALGAGLAPDLPFLLGCRVLQGVGAAATLSLTAGLIRHTYPASQLGRAIGINAFTVASCSAIGPSIGALIITLAGWPFIFLLAVPTGLLVVLVGSRALPEVPPQRRPFDLAGALLTVLSLASLILGLDLLPVLPLLALPILALSAGSFWLLLRVELSRPLPVLPLDLLAIRPVRLAVAASCCMFGAQAILYVALPFHLTAAGRSVAEIGLMVSPWPAAIALAAPIAGRLSDRVLSAWPCAIGAVAVAGGLGAAALLPPGPAMWPIMLSLALAGIGFGSFQAPNNRAMLGHAPRSRAGAAGGMQSTGRVLGQALGTMLVGVCFHLGLSPALVIGLATVAAGTAAALSLIRARGGA